MGHTGRCEKPKLRRNKYPNVTKNKLCAQKKKKEEFIDKSCTGSLFFQLYLILEELLARGILKLQVAKACLLTLKARGTAELWLNAFLPFPKLRWLCCAPWGLHPVMRCWLVQATAQQGTWHCLRGPDWFVAVFETLPWPCVWFLGHCGKKPQKAVLSLKSRTLQVKLKDVFPKLPLKVNQHCSVPQKKRADPEICLQRTTKHYRNIASLGTKKTWQFLQGWEKHTNCCMLWKEKRCILQSHLSFLYLPIP